jgi:hypothetical protein
VECTNEEREKLRFSVIENILLKYIYKKFQFPKIRILKILEIIISILSGFRVATGPMADRLFRREDCDEMAWINVETTSHRQCLKKCEVKLKDEEPSKQKKCRESCGNETEI